MPEKFQTIVVGLGAMGSAAVYQLAKRGTKVLGIEQFKTPHDKGSTHGDTRITRQAIGEGDAYVPFALRSNELWREIERESGESLLTMCGGLTVEPKEGKISHGQFHFLQTTIASAKKYNIPHQVLTVAELRIRFPQFRFRDDEWGYYEEGAGFLRPELCVQAQLDLAQRNGAALNFSEKFLEWKKLEDGTILVTTDAREYITEKLIVSVGPWVGQLFPEYKNIFKVYRQVMYWFDIEGPIESYLPENFPVFMIQRADGKEFYGFPAVDGQGGGLKAACEDLLLDTTPEEVERNISPEETQTMYEKYLHPYLPGLGSKCIKAVTCMYTVTPDSGFVIDTLPDQPNIILASPCSGHGFKHSAAIGEALAQLAIDGKTTLDISKFKLTRFLR